MAFALEVGHKATQITGLEIGVWSEVYGPNVGALAWTAQVPDLLALEQATDKLNVADDFMTAVEHAAELFTGPAEDRLMQIVHGEIDPDRRPSYVAAVRGHLRNGHFADGVGLGMEIADFATRVTGHTTIFCTAVTGDYGEVAWLTGFDDIGQAQEGQAKLMADPDWIKLLDERAGEAYRDDATQLMYRRLT